MKLEQSRPACGPHNSTHKATALPVPSEIKNQGAVRLSWGTHKGADEVEIHSLWFYDEDGKLICTYTVSDSSARPWDKVVHILWKFQKNALRIMEQLNNCI